VPQFANLDEVLAAYRLLKKAFFFGIFLEINVQQLTEERRVSADPVEDITKIDGSQLVHVG
jgi:hypothetical protein